MATRRARGKEPAGPPISRQVIPFLLEAECVDCYRTLHPTTPGYIFHMDHLAFRIDYIFTSPSFANRLAACDVVIATQAEQASDHFPF
jgi:exonuclease III